MWASSRQSMEVFDFGSRGIEPSAIDATDYACELSVVGRRAGRLQSAEYPELIYDAVLTQMRKHSALTEIGASKRHPLQVADRNSHPTVHQGGRRCSRAAKIGIIERDATGRFDAFCVPQSSRSRDE